MHSSSIPRLIKEILVPSHHASFRVPTVIHFGSGPWSRSKSLNGNSICFSSTASRAGKHAHHRWLVVSTMTTSNTAFFSPLLDPSIPPPALNPRDLDVRDRGIDPGPSRPRVLGPVHGPGGGLESREFVVHRAQRCASQRALRPPRGALDRGTDAGTS